jgi:hypothetical protein
MNLRQRQQASYCKFTNMNFNAFRRLSPVVQLLWVIRHGTYLAQRWDDESGVNLYHCEDDGRGFFVEVGID